MQTRTNRLYYGLLLAACLLAIFAGQSRADEAKGVQWHSDLKAAARESQKSQKPMLIEITAVWCTYCKKMKKSFEDDKVARHVNGCFIPVTVDADENQRLVEAVGADALPTTVIVSPEFKLIKKITGYYTPSQLNKQLGEVCPANHEVIAEKPPVSPANPVLPATVSELKPAFDGHCLVSLLDDQKLRVCGADHSVNHKGHLLCFHTAEHKQRFEANPEKYMPALDGFCPVSYLDENKPIPGKAAWGAIYRDHLWFFTSKENRNKFADSPSTYFEKLK